MTSIAWHRLRCCLSLTAPLVDSDPFYCRAGCGACCIAPSITTPFVGMPHGKRAGERCVHLDANNLCQLFGHPDRPDFCAAIQAEPAMCGNSADEAMAILAAWEQATRPDPGITAPADAGKAP